MIYEMQFGKTPFISHAKNRSQLFQNIRTREVIYPKKERYNVKYSDECVSFLNGLLTKEPTERLGYKGGVDEILAHPWFADLDLKKLRAKELEPPFKLALAEGGIDMKFFNAKTSQQELYESVMSPEIIEKVKDKAKAFSGFDQ